MSDGTVRQYKKSKMDKGDLTRALINISNFRTVNINKATKDVLSSQLKLRGVNYEDMSVEEIKSTLMKGNTMDELKGQKIKHNLEADGHVTPFSARGIAVDPEVVIQYEGDEDYYIWTREEVIKDIENGDITLVQD